jgi:hypothetical protein
MISLWYYFWMLFKLQIFYGTIFVIVLLKICHTSSEYECKSQGLFMVLEHSLYSYYESRSQ